MQKRLKSAAAPKPTRTPTMREKVAMLREKRVNKPEAGPVRAMFVPMKARKDYQWEKNQ